MPFPPADRFDLFSQRENERVRQQLAITYTGGKQLR